MGNDRRSPYPGARAYEDFRQKAVERFGNCQSDARNHVIGRNQGVARVLAYLALARSGGAVARESVVAASGAGFQATRGSARLGQQAAHCLPCELILGGREFSSLAPNPRTTREIRTLFGHVSVLPRSFNAADVAAERVENGLIWAFVRSCEALIRQVLNGDGPRPLVFRGIGSNHGMLETRLAHPLDRESVRNVYRIVWKPAAEGAYRAALAAALDGRFLAASDDPAEVVAVLDQYLRAHSIEPSALLDSQLDEIERTFNGVDE